MIFFEKVYIEMLDLFLIGMEVGVGVVRKRLVI